MIEWASPVFCHKAALGVLAGPPEFAVDPGVVTVVSASCSIMQYRETNNVKASSWSFHLSYSWQLESTTA